MRLTTIAHVCEGFDRFSCAEWARGASMFVRTVLGLIFSWNDLLLGTARLGEMPQLVAPYSGSKPWKLNALRWKRVTVLYLRFWVELCTRKSVEIQVVILTPKHDRLGTENAEQVFLITQSIKVKPRNQTIWSERWVVGSIHAKTACWSCFQTGAVSGYENKWKECIPQLRACRKKDDWRRDVARNLAMMTRSLRTGWAHEGRKYRNCRTEIRRKKIKAVAAGKYTMKQRPDYGLVTGNWTLRKDHWWAEWLFVKPDQAKEE